MVQAVDGYNYLNDGGVGWAGPGGAISSTPAAMAPAAPAAATPAGAPAQGLATQPWNADAAAMDGYADDMMDDWTSWMFPTYQQMILRDRSDSDNINWHADQGANRMTDLGYQTTNTAGQLERMQNDLYIPQANRIFADATAFDRVGFAERAAQNALGDMGAAFQNDREATRMRNAQYGIDPTSGRAMAQDRIAQIMHGANTSSAANRARAAAEEIWGKKQMDVMNTSGLLANNANAIGQLRSQAGALHTGSAGIRKLGLDATNQAFTHMSDVVGRTGSIYNTAGGLRNDAGGLRLGGYKAVTDNENTRYGIDKNFEASKYSADKSADAAAAQARATKSAGNASAVGSIIGTAAGYFMF